MPRRQQWQVCQEFLGVICNSGMCQLSVVHTHTLLRLSEDFWCGWNPYGCPKAWKKSWPAMSKVISNKNLLHINTLTLWFSECARMQHGYTTPLCDCLALGHCKYTHMQTHSKVRALPCRYHEGPTSLWQIQSKMCKDAKRRQSKKKKKQSRWASSYLISPVSFKSKNVPSRLFHNLKQNVGILLHKSDESNSPPKD